MLVDFSSGATVLAPAKINLYLGVGELRADGYHDLVTVYQALDLWERVSVTRHDGDSDHLEIKGPSAADVPTTADNLALQAVELLRQHTGNSHPVAIRIDKDIPVAGGMAGGSADAAATLLAANTVLGLGLSLDELGDLAARLGSDIPFSLRGGTMLGTGRGEQLTALLHPGPDLHWVVATARGGLSTPVVYAELDRQRASTGHAVHIAAETMINALRSGSAGEVAQALHNDMQPAAISLMPALRRTLHAGHDAGAIAGMVSGSGPTCVFLCDGREAAITVATELSSRGVAREVRVARGPARGAHLVDT